MRSICNSVISALTLVVCASSVSLFAQASIDQRPVPATVPAAQPLFSIVAPVRTWDFDQVVQKPAGPPPTPRHTGIIAMVKGLGSDVKHLPSRQNLFIFSIGGGLVEG